MIAAEEQANEKRRKQKKFEHEQEEKIWKNEIFCSSAIILRKVAPYLIRVGATFVIAEMTKSILIGK